MHAHCLYHFTCMAYFKKDAEERITGGGAVAAFTFIDAVQ